MDRGSSAVVPVSAPDAGDQTVHELLALREIAIAKAKEMMTSDHDPPTGSPLQQPHRIIAQARCFSAIAQLFVDSQSDNHRIYVRRQEEVAVFVLVTVMPTASA